MMLLSITFASSLMAIVFSDPSTCDLCDCYKFQPAGLPITFNDEICYTYLIHSGSDQGFCDPIADIVLSIENDCGLTPEIIGELLLDYAPKCYDIEFNGTGILLMHSAGSPEESEDYGVFSMCFNALQVSGFNQDGQIGYITTTGQEFACDTPWLPNFCGADSCLFTTTTTAEPTTAEPTAGPTTEPTAEPTTEPTGEPTTAEPTPGPTSNPTTAEPTPGPTSKPTDAPSPEPSPFPTQSPTFEVCNSTDPYNIAFLLDESGSVSSQEWDIIINFVKRVIDFDVQDDSYVALYEFASLPGFERFLNFTGPKSSEQAVMEQALDDNRYKIAGLTETWDAVNRVLDDFYDYTTNEANQDHARGNILFVVTDGNPTDVKGDPRRNDYFISEDYNTCPYIQNRLMTQFPNNYIDIVLVIIDADAEIDIDTSKVECLDYYNNMTDIIPIDTFDSTAFNQIEARIREKICTDGQIGDVATGPGTAVWEYCLNPNDGADCFVGLGPVPVADDGGVSCSNDPGSANPCITSTGVEDSEDSSLESTNTPEF